MVLQERNTKLEEEIRTLRETVDRMLLVLSHRQWPGPAGVATGRRLLSVRPEAVLMHQKGGLCIFLLSVLGEDLENGRRK